MALYLGKKVIATKTPLPEVIGTGATTVRMNRSGQEAQELEYFDIYKITQEEYDAFVEAGTINDNALYLIEGSEGEGGGGSEDSSNSFSPIYTPSESFRISSSNAGQTIQTEEDTNLEINFGINPDYEVGTEFAFLKNGFSTTSELVLNAINGALFAVTGEVQYRTKVRIIDAFGMAAVKYIGGTSEAPVFLVTGNVEVVE